MALAIFGAALCFGAAEAQGGFAVAVFPGFDGVLKAGMPGPISVLVSNSGPPASGQLLVFVRPPGADTQVFRRDLDLSEGAKRFRFTILAPRSFMRVLAVLRIRGIEVARDERDCRPIDSAVHLIGARDVMLPDLRADMAETHRVVRLGESDLAEARGGSEFAGLTAIILDPRGLDAERETRRVLRDYVLGGGRLVVSARDGTTDLSALLSGAPPARSLFDLNQSDWRVMEGLSPAMSFAGVILVLLLYAAVAILGDAVLIAKLRKPAATFLTSACIAGVFLIAVAMAARLSGGADQARAVVIGIAGPDVSDGASIRFRAVIGYGAQARGIRTFRLQGADPVLLPLGSTGGGILGGDVVEMTQARDAASVVTYLQPRSRVFLLAEWTQSMEPPIELNKAIDPDQIRGIRSLRLRGLPPGSRDSGWEPPALLSFPWDQVAGAGGLADFGEALRSGHDVLLVEWPDLRLPMGIPAAIPDDGVFAVFALVLPLLQGEGR